MFVIGTPHARGAGYFTSDDTPSGGARREDDVRTCVHCQAVILMRAWNIAGSPWCLKCAAPICHACAQRMQAKGCEPFVRMVERALATDYQRKQYRKLAGL